MADTVEDNQPTGEGDARPAGPAPASRSCRPLWWLDAVIVVLLCCAAWPLRWSATRGDLWLDEGDYALAAVRGVAANRWDRSELPGDPDRLLRLRHYHPPLVVYAVRIAEKAGLDDSVLRAPFVAAGALTVGVVYLLGLAVLRRPDDRGLLDTSALHPARVASLACAAVLVFTPPHIRASSHALPWAFITLWLVLLTWCVAAYVNDRRPGWVVAALGTLALLFATSEYFFPALLALALCASLALAPAVRDARARRGLLVGFAVGAGLFIAIAWVLWPAGLVGGSLKMLRHYAAMSHDPFAVQIRGRLYEHAPKWAYAYWYWRDYKPYTVFYMAGALAALLLLARRRLTASAGVLLLFAAVVLLTAHRSHIIGPEYLAHALPFLTLLGGLFLVSVSRLSRPLGLVAAALVLFAVIRRHDAGSLPGMDSRARLSRWPAAAGAIAAAWHPGDRMLAPQYGGVGRWYLLHVARVPARDWQVQALPGSLKPGPFADRFLADLRSGVYRFVAVGSTFSDQPSIDRRVAQVVDTWPVLWESDEHGTGPSRLVIRQLPRGVTRRTPLPMPGAPVHPAPLPR